jgi:hypothetical protein
MKLSKKHNMLIWGGAILIIIVLLFIINSFLTKENFGNEPFVENQCPNDKPFYSSTDKKCKSNDEMDAICKKHINETFIYINRLKNEINLKSQCMSQEAANKIICPSKLYSHSKKACRPKPLRPKPLTINLGSNPSD